MAYDIYMQIQGIKGDSTDLVHKEWIEVVGYSHEVLQAKGVLNQDIGHVGGKATLKDFVITKKLDKASPTLFLYCCTGRPIGEVEIEICRAMGTKIPFMKYKLKKVIVSSYRPDAESDSDDMLPTERVTLRYAQIELEYTQTDPTGGGKKGGSVRASYDLRSDMEY